MIDLCDSGKFIRQDRQTKLKKPKQKNDKMYLTYILTIEQSDGIRRNHCVAEGQRLGLDLHFIQGITADSPEISSVYSKFRNSLYLKRSLTRGEIACYIGHRRLWQAFLNDRAEIGLFCEDDFQVIDDEAFSEALIEAVKRDDWDVLKFFDFGQKKILKSVPLGSLSIVDYKYPAAGAVCYLMRRSAAERLLSRKKIFRPVDEDFRHCWELGIRVRSVYPNPVAEIATDMGGSILQTERAMIQQRRNRLRSFWGMFLDGYKRVRARIYRASLAKTTNRDQ